MSVKLAPRSTIRLITLLGGVFSALLAIGVAASKGLFCEYCHREIEGPKQSWSCLLKEVGAIYESSSADPLPVVLTSEKCLKITEKEKLSSIEINVSFSGMPDVGEMMDNWYRKAGFERTPSVPDDDVDQVVVVFELLLSRAQIKCLIDKQVEILSSEDEKIVFNFSTCAEALNDVETRK